MKNLKKTQNNTENVEGAEEVKGTAPAAEEARKNEKATEEVTIDEEK